MSCLKIVLLLVVIASTSYCHPHRDLDHIQSSVLLARDTSTSADTFPPGIQKKAAGNTVTGGTSSVSALNNTLPLSSNKTLQATNKTDPKKNSTSQTRKVVAIQNYNATTDQRDPKEKLEGRIKKHKLDIKKLQKKITNDEMKLKAMINGTTGGSFNQVSKDKHSKHDENKGAIKNSTGHAVKPKKNLADGSEEEKKHSQTENRIITKDQLGGLNEKDPIKKYLKDNKVVTPTLDSSEKNSTKSTKPSKTTVELPSRI